MWLDLPSVENGRVYVSAVGEFGALRTAFNWLFSKMLRKPI